MANQIGTPKNCFLSKPKSYGTKNQGRAGQLYRIQLGHFRHGGGDFPWEDSRDLHTAPAAAVEPSNSEKCMMYAACRQLHIKLNMHRLFR